MLPSLYEMLCWPQGWRIREDNMPRYVSRYSYGVNGWWSVDIIDTTTGLPVKHIHADNAYLACDKGQQMADEMNAADLTMMAAVRQPVVQGVTA